MKSNKKEKRNTEYKEPMAMRAAERSFFGDFFHPDVKPSKITLCLFPLLFGISGDLHAEMVFNPAFLEGGATSEADLEMFQGSDSQPDGEYQVDIYLNEQLFSKKKLQFNKNSQMPNGLYPCLTLAMLKEMGVLTASLKEIDSNNDGQCIDLSKSIPMSQVEFDFEHQLLKLSIPQAHLGQMSRGFVSPTLWDEGINALLLNYSYSGSNTRDKNTTTRNDYLNLRSGINLGAWRYRNYSTWSQGENGKHWDNISNYLQRNIIALKSQLVMGDTYTPSDVFDSLSFRGIQLSSDDNMLPDSEKGFAPLVRGVALSSSKVTIRQNGYIIYQSYVPAGPFEIKDLYPTSGSGDLQVTVRENSGSEQVYTVPYSAVPILQREGKIKFSLTGGEYRSGFTSGDKPRFAQGTLIWGLPRDYTLYTGSQFSDNYHSVALGLGKNLTMLGAVSADVTWAKTELTSGDRQTGYSYRFLYAKSFMPYSTNLRLVGYRYSTKGFYSFEEAQARHSANADSLDGYVYDNYHYHKRSRMQLSVSQPIKQWGSIYISASQQDYWNTSDKQTLLQLGYSGTLGDVSYNLGYNHTKNPGSTSNDDMISVNLSVPFSALLGQDRWSNNAWATYNMTGNNHGKTSHQVGISGTALEQDNLNYSIQQSYSTNQDASYAGDIYADYQGTYFKSSAGYSYDKDNRQLSYGLQGSLMVHRNGITFGQPTGDTAVLVAVPGASGVEVNNNVGTNTDWRGYAIIPYATPYHENRVELGMDNLSEEIELDTPVQKVVPTQGAIVRAGFKARMGKRVLLTLMYQGKPLPFGTMVSVDNDDNSQAGIVGDDGQIYLSGLQASGELLAKWGKLADQQCRVDYDLATMQAAGTSGLLKQTLNCR